MPSVSIYLKKIIIIIISVLKLYQKILKNTHLKTKIGFPMVINEIRLRCGSIWYTPPQIVLPRELLYLLKQPLKGEVQFPPDCETTYLTSMSSSATSNIKTLKYFCFGFCSKFTLHLDYLLLLTRKSDSISTCT